MSMAGGCFLRLGNRIASGGRRWPQVVRQRKVLLQWTICERNSFLQQQRCFAATGNTKSYNTKSGEIVEGEIIAKNKPPHENNPAPDSTDTLESELKQALQHHQSLLDDGSDKDAIVASLHNIRDYYEKLQWWDDALQTETTRLEYVDNDSKERSDCFGRMGRYYMELNKLGKAKRCFQTCLDIMLEDVHPNEFHRDLGRAYSDLARVVLEQGNTAIEDPMPYLEQAENHYRYHGKSTSDFDILNDDYDLEEEINKNNDPQPHDGELPKILMNQALRLRINDRPDLARIKYQEAMDLDVDDKTRVELQCMIADCLVSMEEFDQALSHYQDALENMKKQGEEGTELEGMVRHCLGVIHAKQGRNDVALQEFKSAYDIKRRTLGESHVEVASSLNGLGAVHATLNNMGEALSYFREALLIARVNAQEDLGENDPQVQHALRNIALVQGDIPRSGSKKPDRLS